MKPEDVRLMFRTAADTLFEGLPCQGFTLGDIRLSKVQAFLREAGTALKVTHANLPAFLSSLSTCHDGAVTNAGALLFAADINKFIPQSEIIMGAFKGTERTYIYDRKDSRADLLTQFNEAIEFIQKHINVRSEIRGLNRFEIYELPLDALREAVVNAIVHRDYSRRGTSVYISVYDDRVDISNPGGLLPGITPGNFGKESVRRNPVIADIFHRMGKVERMGTGIRRMKDLMRAAGLEAPEFTSDTFFHAIFRRSPEFSLKRKHEEVTVVKTVVKTEDKIIALIKDNPTITRVMLKNQTGLSIRGVEWNLRRLKAAGVIRRIGPDKGGHWEILK